MGRLLRPYLATFASRFQLTLQYRAAAIAGFFTQSWFGAIMIMVLAAFYAVRGASAPLSLGQAITYTWMSQAFILLLPFGGDPNVAAAVRSGAVGYDRLRPVDAHAWWFVGAAGWMLARMAPRTAMICTLAALVLPLAGLGEWSWRPPAGPAQTAAFALSLALSVAVSSAMTVLLNLLSVITMDERGTVSIIAAATIAFSGNLLPLPLFPQWMHGFLLVQPFASLIDIPIRLYLGQLSGAAAALALGIQLLWALALIGLGRALTEAVMRRLQVQGG